MWCWRRMEKINCTNTVINEEILHRCKEGRNILCAVKRKQDKRIGQNLLKSCHLGIRYCRKDRRDAKKRRKM